MSDKKRTPREPVQEERRALEGYTDEELVSELGTRQSSIGLVLGKGDTFKNPFDYPLLFFFVPEMKCDFIKPRLQERFLNYALTHGLFWKMFCSLAFFGIAFVVIVIIKLVSIA